MALTVAELDAKLTLDDAQFQSGLRGTEQGMDSLRQRGEGMKSVGDSMTKNVSLPIVAVGVAAGKVAMDFDSSMSRIVGLVGVASDEVDEMRGGVLELSGETTKSPQELADALFTVTSAGFRGSEAMDVLEMSAKASAAGLGETRDIAEAVTATINTYGSDVIDAAAATDILVATAQAGNFATEDLAGGLGRVLPTAKAAEVSFADLGGAIALATKQNNDANQSITQADALFRSFVKPSAQARDTLASIGLTADQVRRSFGREGLHPTLLDLEERLIAQTGSTAAAREEMGKIIEDSSGYSLALMMLNADLETIEGTIGVTNDATGMLGDAWAAFAGNDSFEAQRALAQLQVALIRLGEIILPVAGKIFGFAADVMSAFADLPEPVLVTVVAFAALVAAVGPVLSIGGRILILMGSLKSAFLATRTALSAVGLSMGAAGIAMGGLSIAAIGLGMQMQSNAEASAASKARVDELTAALKETGGAWEGAAVEALNANGALDGIKPTLVGLGVGLDDVVDALAGGPDAWQKFTDETLDAAEKAGLTQLHLMALEASLDQVGKEADRAGDKFDANAEFTEEAGDAAEGAAGGFDEMGDAVDASAEAIEAATAALDEYLDSIAEAIDDSFSLDQAQRGVQEAFEAAEEALKESNGEMGAHSEEARKAEAAAEDLTTSTWDLIAASVREADSQEDAEAAVSDHRAELRRQLRQLGLNKGEVDKYVGALDEADGDWIAELRADILNMAEVQNYSEALRNIPRFVTTSISAAVSSSGLSGRAHGGPVRRGVPYIVGEERAELYIPDEDGTILPHVPASFDASMFGGGPLMAPTGAPLTAAGSSSNNSSREPTVIVLQASDRLGSALMDALSAEVKRRGGGGPDSVQIAFGNR